MLKYILLSSSVLIGSISLSEINYSNRNIFEIKISNFNYEKDSMPKNRRHSITDKVELDKELNYLKKNFNKEKPDELIRIFDYVLKNPEDRGYVINKFSMFRDNDINSMDNIKYIIDFLKERTYALDTYKIPKNGVWSGQAGHSIFILTGHTNLTTKNEFLEVAPNGVPFEFGYPNFTEFKIGNSLPIESPTGSYEHDYEKTITLLIMNNKPFNDIIFTSKDQFYEYLQSTYSKLEYSFSGDSFDIIPIHVSSIINYVYPYYKKKKIESLYKNSKK